MSVPVRLLRASLLLPVLGGCAGEEVGGVLFDVSLVTQENDCTGGSETYAEEYRYRLIKEQDLSIRLAVEDDEWATGTIDGCRIEYRTVTWTSLRDGYEIRWQLQGTATIDESGGDTCNTEEPGLDWIGQETFTVTRSENPEVDPGCTYSLDVTGRFVGLAEDLGT